MTIASQRDSVMTIAPQHLTVPRTARYFTVGNRAKAEEIWFVLHGYSQLASGFLRWFEPALRPGRVIVAPEGLSRSYFEEKNARRVGASWMTKEDRESEIMDYVRYLDLLGDEVVGELPPRPRLQVHGFSQGAATACRWVGLGHHDVHRLVLWGGTVPPDLDLERLRVELRDATLTIIMGEQDPYTTPDLLSREQARLREAGLNVELKVFAGGHRIDPGVLAEMAR